MKSFKTILAVALMASSTAFASGNPMACFEREWIISASNSRPATMSMEQLSQAIQVQMPYLSVKQAESNRLLVEYKQVGQTAREDVAKLRQAFAIFTQQVGLLVECNATVEPMPSMTGLN